MAAARRRNIIHLQHDLMKAVSLRLLLWDTAALAPQFLVATTSRHGEILVPYEARIFGRELCFTMRANKECEMTPFMRVRRRMLLRLEIPGCLLAGTQSLEHSRSQARFMDGLDHPSQQEGLDLCKMAEANDRDVTTNFEASV